MGKKVPLFVIRRPVLQRITLYGGRFASLCVVPSIQQNIFMSPPKLPYQT